MSNLKWVKEYQCSGCVCGSDTSCYVKDDTDKTIRCSKHVCGTTMIPIGKIFLGMPTGFNRVGIPEDVEINIYEKFEDGWRYDKLNVPVWKYLDENGNTIVRGLSPRVNKPFLHIFLGNCIDKINCLEITKTDIEEMD